MKIKLLITVFAIVMLGCKDDDDVRPSIVGKWHGDYIDLDVKYGFIPVYSETDDDFNVNLEFREDGTATFERVKDGTEVNGTYSVNGSKLTTDIDFQLYESASTSTFDIIELSERKLRLRVNDKQTVNLPDFGNVELTITGTLEFMRE
jgi:uncharacterized protein (TIGR03066 family)